MSDKDIIITNDKSYAAWLQGLAQNYRRSQIKAAIKVNTEMLRFYWQLGHDIVEMDVESRWGQGVVSQLCKDLKKMLPNAKGLTRSNIYYCKSFYLLYKQEDTNFPQLVEIFEVPWGHHRYIIDKVKGDTQKALFYVRQTVENGWSRAMLLTWLDTDLYERQGKAISNFTQTLPEETSDLAQELTKDPYNFAFTGLTKRYNEMQLKAALLANITKFLIELGNGFAYVGQEYRLQIGEKEKFIDLLFYNLKVRCYVVIEVKIGEFDSADMGQLGTYVTAVNHKLRDESVDNPTIGILLCKKKDNVLAQYALESSSQPIAISEFELQQLYPVKVEGTIPTIEQFESQLKWDEQLSAH